MESHTLTLPHHRLPYSGVTSSDLEFFVVDTYLKVPYREAKKVAFVPKLASLKAADQA